MTAQEWNDKYPIIQDVNLTEDDGRITATKTRSIAWDTGDGVPIIKVDGKSGGYSLARIKPRA